MLIIIRTARLYVVVITCACVCIYPVVFRTAPTNAPQLFYRHNQRQCCSRAKRRDVPVIKTLIISISKYRQRGKLVGMDLAACTVVGKSFVPRESGSMQFRRSSLLYVILKLFRDLLSYKNAVRRMEYTGRGLVFKIDSTPALFHIHYKGQNVRADFRAIKLNEISY